MRVFSHFPNCENGTKSRKAPHIEKFKTIMKYKMTSTVNVLSTFLNIDPKRTTAMK